MANLSPGSALRLSYNNGARDGLESKVTQDKRTHYERIVDAVKSVDGMGTGLESLKVSYNGQNKSLQDYFLEDVFPANESNVLSAKILSGPVPVNCDFGVRAKLRKYWWSHEGWTPFVLAYYNAKKLSVANWAKEREIAVQLATNTSIHVNTLLGKAIFSKYDETKCLREKASDLDRIVKQIRQDEERMPVIYLKDYVSGRSGAKRRTKANIKMELECNAFELVQLGKIMKSKISSLGNSVRKDYFNANPEQTRLFENI